VRAVPVVVVDVLAEDQPQVHPWDGRWSRPGARGECRAR
jgi:hypothetical protein